MPLSSDISILSPLSLASNRRVVDADDVDDETEQWQWHAHAALPLLLVALLVAVVALLAVCVDVVVAGAVNAWTCPTPTKSSTGINSKVVTTKPRLILGNGRNLLAIVLLFIALASLV